MSSNPSHGNVIFIIGFFPLNFLHHGSIQSVVCLLWSLFVLQHYRGIKSQQWKIALETHFTLLEEISIKLLAVLSVGQKHGCKCDVWGK